MKVVGLGAGGHARVLVDALRCAGGHDVVAFTDPDNSLWGTTVVAIPVRGGDDILPMLREEGVTGFFVGVGSTRDATLRRLLWNIGISAGLKPVLVVHPTAVVSPSASVGEGVAILALAVVNSGAAIGNNVIVNTSAVVEHDCAIGDHAHIATGAKLAGAVVVGAGSHVGVGAAVRQGIVIGEGAVVGAGAAVVRDVAPGTTVVGVPARELPRRDWPRESGTEGHS